MPVTCQQPSIRQECLHCCCHLFVNDRVTVNSTVNNCYHFSKALNVWVLKPKTSQCQPCWNLQLASWCWTLWFVLPLFPPQWHYSPFCTALVLWIHSGQLLNVVSSSVTLFSILYSSGAMRSVFVNSWMLYSNSSWKLSFSRSLCTSPACINSVVDNWKCCLLKSLEVVDSLAGWAASTCHSCWKLWPHTRKYQCF